jgi:CubicO group peptidase (beta-lactamase class C family)
VEDGAPAWTRSVGVTNVETKVPVAGDTVLAAASLGKPVLGYVVLRLADEGRLDLDRPLVSYYRPEDLPADPNLGLITARHVLSHTTGLRNWRNRADQKLVPDFAPGTRFQYSGEGFFWLQQVVESVTGQGVDRVMRERLFGPAGMSRATYAWSSDHDGWTAYGHTNRGDVGNQFGRALGNKMLLLAARWGKPMTEWTTADTFRALPEADPSVPRLPNFVLPNVAGSLLCTATEYARFLALMLDGRRRADWEIDDATRRAMLASRIELKPGALSWGLGWALERHSTGALFWHWGDNGIYKAFTGRPGPAAGDRDLHQRQRRPQGLRAGGAARGRLRPGRVSLGVTPRADREPGRSNGGRLTPRSGDRSARPARRPIPCRHGRRRSSRRRSARFR